MSHGDGGRSLETGGRRTTAAAALGEWERLRAAFHIVGMRSEPGGMECDACRRGRARGAGLAWTRAGSPGNPAVRKGSAQGAAPLM